MTNFLIIFGLALLVCAVLTYAAYRVLKWWGAKQEAVERQSALVVEDLVLAKAVRIQEQIEQEAAEDLWSELEKRHGDSPGQ